MRFKKLMCWLGWHYWIDIAPCRDHDWSTAVCWYCGVRKGAR